VDEEGMLVGYVPHSKAWQALVDTESCIFIRESRNVTFDETRTCASIYEILTEHPDANVRPAEGSNYAEVTLSSRKRVADVIPETSDVTADHLAENDSEFDPENEHEEALSASQNVPPPIPPVPDEPEDSEPAEAAEENAAAEPMEVGPRLYPLRD
jgi:hypothetical protein